MAGQRFLHLVFRSCALTVRGTPDITFLPGAGWTSSTGRREPCLIDTLGIQADPAELVRVRVLTETDLDELGIPRNIEIGWRHSP